MTSIRRPKRIIIRGDDERDHPFLVKGGEDLRQDQRIEQLFGVMNMILSQDTACSQRSLALRTYQVIPITSRYLDGLLMTQLVCWPVFNWSYRVFNVC